MEGNVIALIMVAIAILALAPILVTGAALWWRAIREAFREFEE